MVIKDYVEKICCGSFTDGVPALFLQYVPRKYCEVDFSCIIVYASEPFNDVKAFFFCL